MVLSQPPNVPRFFCVNDLSFLDRSVVSDCYTGVSPKPLASGFVSVTITRNLLRLVVIKTRLCLRYVCTV